MTRAAVIGSPISHSLSPALHRAAYQALGLDWTYDRFEVDADHLQGFVAGLDDSWAGLSLTMPLKEAVLDLAADVEWTARVTMSANTLLLGSRAAFNTDVDGIRVALQRAGFAATGFSATVIGAGATARSAIAAAQQLGAERVCVLARRPHATQEAVRTAHEVGLPIEVHPWEHTEHLAGELVISTVPKGAADDLAGATPSAPGCLLDVVYDPWPTRLAKAWSDEGGVVVSGLEMLLAQAERQVELMTGLTAPTQAMRAALPVTHS